MGEGGCALKDGFAGSAVRVKCGYGTLIQGQPPGQQLPLSRGVPLVIVRITSVTKGLWRRGLPIRQEMREP